jgi:hypothetical protein
VGYDLVLVVGYDLVLVVGGVVEGAGGGLKLCPTASAPALYPCGTMATPARGPSLPPALSHPANSLGGARGDRVA